MCIECRAKEFATKSSPEETTQANEAEHNDTIHGHGLNAVNEGMLKRKDSELENLLLALDKELIALDMESHSFIQNVGSVLAPEREDAESRADMPSPSSPMGQRVFQITYRVQNIREKINAANERVRV